MLSQIVNLRDATSEYGGKALGLHRLCSFDVPVPFGIALSPLIVKQIVSDPKNKKYKSLISEYINFSEAVKYAVRSSALNEDGGENSFAGMYDTVLNVPSDLDSIISAIITVYNGQNSDRVLSYMLEKGILIDEGAQLGIIIQKMVDPEIAGVAFTAAIGTSGQSTMLLECVSGLGDKLVNGQTTPTRIEIPLKANGDVEISNIIISGPLLNTQGLSALITIIANIAKLAKQDLDIEWAIDKYSKPWLLQARPITKILLVPSTVSSNAVPASSGIANGLSFVVNSEDDLDNFPNKGILVAKVTEAQYLPAMRKASAIITEEGGILSHAAIVSREIGIPCVVGYKDAIKYFPTGSNITVDGTSGIVTNDTNPVSANNDLTQQAIDWGAAYLFEQLMPIKIDETIGLFNPVPVGIALHIPENISSDIDEKFELFSRKHFGKSPRRYQSDKYLWYFEWERFQNIDFFRENLRNSIKAVELLDAVALTEHYNIIIAKSLSVLKMREQSTDPALQFLLDECLLSTHFLLTMLIPEGYALRSMYSVAQPLLDIYKLTFTDLLSGEKSIISTDPLLAKIANFSAALSLLRNEIYARLLETRIARDDYFEDRDERAKQAISFMNWSYSSDQDPVAFFYNTFESIPMIK